MPDEEFDARFRQGLEQYPEQPEDPVAWHRMGLLLDADLRQRAYRRRILRLLGAELVLIILVIGGILQLVVSKISINATSPQLAKAIRPTAPQAHQAPLVFLPSKTGTAPIPEKMSAAGSPLAARKEFLSKDKLTTPELASREHQGTSWHLPSTATATQQQHRAARLSLAASARRQHQAARLPLAASAHQWHAHVSCAAGIQFGTLAGSNTRTHLAHAARLRRPDETASQHLAVIFHRDKPDLYRVRRPLPPERLATVAGRPAAASSAIGSIDLLPARPLTGAMAFYLPDSLARLGLLAATLPADSLAPPRVAWEAYRLRLGLVAAPELSAVRADHLEAPGGDVGIQLDYQLARRWHLSTAYLLTVKRYAARPEDYHLPSGYSIPNGWVVSNVDAVCRIVDIPLNLRYDLHQRPNYQVFASVGLSSLLMRSEQYTYDYEPAMGQPVPSYNWELLNGSQHVLKVLNLSAGYERRLSGRWTLQAEPFVKLPLGGIGFGTVRLSSAGVFFSLRYGLLPEHSAAPR